MTIRKRIFQIIEVSEGDDKYSVFYDILMLFAIIVSIIPLAFKKAPSFFYYSDIVTTVLFIVDYLLRLLTSDYKLNKKIVPAILIYPFTPWAIIDLVSILPTLTVLSSGFKLFRLLRIFRTFRAFRVFRIFKAFRYSKSIAIIFAVIKKSKEPLIAVCIMAFLYILTSALIIFSVEPDSFRNFFDAIYWATVSLTTVGYGDIYPVSTAGRVITMISSIFGIAVVALPAGIITAGYMEALQEEKKGVDDLIDSQKEEPKMFLYEEYIIQENEKLRNKINRDNVLRLLSKGKSPEEINDLLDIPMEEILSIRDEEKVEA